MNVRLCQQDSKFIVKYNCFRTAALTSEGEELWTGLVMIEPYVGPC